MAPQFVHIQESFVAYLAERVAFKWLVIFVTFPLVKSQIFSRVDLAFLAKQLRQSKGNKLVDEFKY